MNTPPTKAVRVAIIGSSQSNLFATYFPKMVKKVKALVDSKQNVTYVSGGSAGSDHVAVALFLESKDVSLHLYLPCDFIGRRFYETPESGDWKTNPGKSLNVRHRQFSKQIGVETLDQIAEAIGKGASFTVGKGFHDRNTMVSENCDVLIAFTDTPEIEGGTLDTWKKVHCKKIHVPILSLKDM